MGSEMNKIMKARTAITAVGKLPSWGALCLAVVHSIHSTHWYPYLWLVRKHKHLALCSNTSSIIMCRWKHRGSHSSCQRTIQTRWHMCVSPKFNRCLCLTAGHIMQFVSDTCDTVRLKGWCGIPQAKPPLQIYPANMFMRKGVCVWRCTLLQAQALCPVTCGKCCMPCPLRGAAFSVGNWHACLCSAGIAKRVDMVQFNLRHCSSDKLQRYNHLCGWGEDDDGEHQVSRRMQLCSPRASWAQLHSDPP